MVVTRQGDAPLYTGAAETKVAVHAALNVDNDVIIDAHDSTHVIRIEHVLNDGKDVIAAFDKQSGAKTMHVDSTGDVFSAAVGPGSVAVDCAP